jgi:hypothetical protein
VARAPESGDSAATMGPAAGRRALLSGLETGLKEGKPSFARCRVAATHREYRRYNTIAY